MHRNIISRSNTLLVGTLILGLVQINWALENKQKKEDEIHINALNEIIVTATRTKTPLKDAPVKVTVIEKDEIQNSPDETLDDFLRRIPDVNLKGSKRTEFVPREVTLRGIPSQGRTLILVDGIPINGNWHGWTSWSMIPKNIVKRIEIVRGPMSALYGSGAMGGVINIITDVPKKKNQTTIESGYGSMNTLTGALSQGGCFNKFIYNINGKIYKTDGYIAAKAPKKYNTENARTDWNGLGKFMLFPDGKSSLIFELAHNNEDVDRGRTYAHHNMKNSYSHLIYERNTKKYEINASIYGQYQDWDIDFDFGAGPPTYNKLIFKEDFNLLAYGELLKLSIPVAKTNMITSGIDYKHSSIQKEDNYITVKREGETNGKQHLTSLFLQDEMKLLNDKLIFTLGARVDYCKSYDGSCRDNNPAPLPAYDKTYKDRDWNAICPKGGIVYHLGNKTTFRVSAGRAFSAPSLPRLYTIMQRGTRLIKGNPELGPETANSYEIGTDHWFLNNLLFKLSFYHTDGNDFISSRTIATNILQFDNITRVRMQGAETDVQYEITKQLSCYGGYTFNKSIIKKDEGNSSIEGNDLENIPRLKGGLGITFKNPKIFTANAYYKYIGKTYTDLENTKIRDSYWTVDLNISRKIWKYAKISLGVENLLDLHYDLDGLEDSEAPGRVINGLLSINF